MCIDNEQGRYFAVRWLTYVLLSLCRGVCGTEAPICGVSEHLDALFFVSLALKPFRQF